jgi:hypothetical protein
LRQENIKINMERRGFLKVLGFLGVAVAVPKVLSAEKPSGATKNSVCAKVAHTGHKGYNVEALNEYVNRAEFEGVKGCIWQTGATEPIGDVGKQVIWDKETKEWREVHAETIPITGNPNMDGIRRMLEYKPKPLLWHKESDGSWTFKD